MVKAPMSVPALLSPGVHFMLDSEVGQESWEIQNALKLCAEPFPGRAQAAQRRELAPVSAQGSAEELKAPMAVSDRIDTEQTGGLSLSPGAWHI